jgi:acyl-homoserine lactone acylase PvdQ
MRGAKWVVIPTLIGITAYFVYQSPKVLPIEGLDADVDIVYNDWGIPYISATTTEDAIFALGYAHARDRQWQMDLSRRLAKGELSELVGELALETDVFMRTIGIKRNVEGIYRTLSAEDKVLLLKYAEGINTYVLQQAWLPLEYLISWSTWTPWHPTDTIALTKLMGLSLNVGWVGKTIRYKLVKALGEEAAAVLLPHQHERMRKGTYILDEEDLEEGADDSEASSHSVGEEASGDERVEEESEDDQAEEDHDVVEEDHIALEVNDEDQEEQINRAMEDIQEEATEKTEEAPEVAEEVPEDAEEAIDDAEKSTGDAEEVPEEAEEAPEKAEEAPEKAEEVLERAEEVPVKVEEVPEDEADDTENEASRTELDVDASEALEGVGEVTDKMINKSTWASNNWVVAGEFTRSGKPMMAYDPHLATTIPNSWHLADIRVQNDDIHIAGAFLPGTYLKAEDATTSLLGEG